MRRAPFVFVGGPVDCMRKIVARERERARLFIDCILLLLRHSARGHTQKWTQTAAINCARLPKIINGPHSQRSVIFSQQQRPLALAIILSRSNIHLFIYDLRKRCCMGGCVRLCVGRTDINSSKCNWKTIWPAIWFYYMYVIHAALQRARFASFHSSSASRNRSWHWFSFGLGPHSPNLLYASQKAVSTANIHAPFHTGALPTEKRVS